MAGPGRSVKPKRGGCRSCSKLAGAFGHESRNLYSPERARFLNQIIAHNKVNPRRIKADVHTLGKTHLDTYIANIITDIVRWRTEPLTCMDKIGMQVSVR